MWPPVTRGGVKKSWNSCDLIYGWPLSNKQCSNTKWSIFIVTPVAYFMRNVAADYMLQTILAIEWSREISLYKSIRSCSYRRRDSAITSSKEAHVLISNSEQVTQHCRVGCLDAWNIHVFGDQPRYKIQPVCLYPFSFVIQLYRDCQTLRMVHIVP